MGSIAPGCANQKLQRRVACALSALAAVLCLGMSSCVSPDLEPPGSVGNAHPESPNAGDHGANAGSKAAADAGVARPPMGGGGRLATQDSDEAADAGASEAKR